MNAYSLSIIVSTISSVSILMSLVHSGGSVVFSALISLSAIPKSPFTIDVLKICKKKIYQIMRMRYVII